MPRYVLLPSLHLLYSKLQELFVHLFGFGFTVNSHQEELCSCLYILCTLYNSYVW